MWKGTHHYVCSSLNLKKKEKKNHPLCAYSKVQEDYMKVFEILKFPFISLVSQKIWLFLWKVRITRGNETEFWGGKKGNIWKFKSELSLLSEDRVWYIHVLDFRAYAGS